MNSLMKILLLCTLFLFASGTIADSKRFQVTYSVTFNSLTLEQAAKKEAMFRELFKEACKIDVKVEEVGPNVLSLDSLSAMGRVWIPRPDRPYDYWYERRPITDTPWLTLDSLVIIDGRTGDTLIGRATQTN